MDRHVKEFYCQPSDEAPRGNFHSVIALHDAPDIGWDSLKKQVPTLSRGWYELSRLPNSDRIEFTRDFWLAKLPYQSTFISFIDRFFASVDEICIFITQKRFDDPYKQVLVYTMKDNNGFFSGNPPIAEPTLKQLQESFPSCIFPVDYLAFLQIHNGFNKSTDCTGITPAEHVLSKYQELQKLIEQHDPIILNSGTLVDPTTLIPFYESFGMPFFQCFWADWYPDQEMGNVYYCSETKTISDVSSSAPGTETMAFPSFLDWLMFYLEGIQ